MLKILFHFEICIFFTFVSAIETEFNNPVKSLVPLFIPAKSENKSLLENNVIIVVVSCIFKLYLSSYHMK